MAKRPGYLQYANDETPPPLSTAILAFQHSAIVLINLVYVVIIAKALNLSGVDQFAMLSTTLLVAGLPEELAELLVALRILSVGLAILGALKRVVIGEDEGTLVHL